MNRLPEAVNQQFNQLFAAISKAGDDLKMAGAEACMSGNFVANTANIDKFQKLQALELEIRTSLSQFEKGYALSPAEKTTPRRNRSRKPRGLIRVSLPHRIIQEHTIAQTFLETLKSLGLERVARLNKVVTSVPLVSRQPANGYQRQERVNGWYITTHINQTTATAVLQEIAKELNVAIKIEPISR